MTSSCLVFSDVESLRFPPGPLLLGAPLYSTMHMIVHKVSSPFQLLFCWFLRLIFMCSTRVGKCLKAKRLEATASMSLHFPSPWVSPFPKSFGCFHSKPQLQFLCLCPMLLSKALLVSLHYVHSFLIVFSAWCSALSKNHHMIQSKGKTNMSCLTNTHYLPFS